MTLSIADALCPTRAHCAACRDTGDVGRAFRASAARAFGVPADFDCPHGLAWDCGPQPILVPAGAGGPVTRDLWPGWADAIADLREPGDKGVGDTVHRKLAEGGLAFKLTLRAMGVACGCDERREQWNAMYPYAGETDG